MNQICLDDSQRRRKKDMSTKYFVVGMPKAGTTSLSAFFSCKRLRVSHQVCGHQTCAGCIKKNMEQHRSALHGCDQYDVYTQLDYEIGFCFFPQRHLEVLHDSYPDSIFILNTREPINWVNSVTNWGNMRSRLSNCGFGYDFSDDAKMVEFYHSHLNYVREFAQMYNHSLIEVDIEKNVSTFASQLNVSSTCYSQRNVHHPILSSNRTICFVGDSLVRYMWCWYEWNSIHNCSGHMDQHGNGSVFYWKPTLANISQKNYQHCSAIVWNNLFHEVRENPRSFDDMHMRNLALQRTYKMLSSVSRRVIFYASQRPTGAFARSRYNNLSMLDAWSVDHKIANNLSSKWLMVRADVYPTEGQMDGRHYDTRGVEDLYTNHLKKFLVFE